MKPALEGSATEASCTAPVESSVSRETEESSKSASPRNGTRDSSWLMNASTVPGDEPGIRPIPSGRPENVKPPSVSPLLMIARSDVPAGAVASSVRNGA